MPQWWKPASMLQDDVKTAASPNERLASHHALPQGYGIVTLEDIFTEPMGASDHGHGRDSRVLLVRQGKWVSSEQLMSLIKQGAQPNQFAVSPLPGESGASGVSDSATKYHTSPLQQPGTAPSASAVQAYSWLLIDTDERSLARLMNITTLQGVIPDDLHCLKDLAQWERYVEAYQPKILIISDERFEGSNVMLQRLQHHRAQKNIERVVILTRKISDDMPTSKRLAAQQWHAAIEAVGFQVMVKPVNAFTLTPLLNSYKAYLKMKREFSQQVRQFRR